MGLLVPHHLTRLLEVVAVVSHAYPRTGIDLAHKLAAVVAVRQVYYGYGHLVDHLVVVYP